MKFFRAFALLCGIAILASAATFSTKSVKIQTNAVCGMCKDRIETGLAALDGVVEARLDLTTKKVKVDYDDSKQSEASLRLAISKMGYGADATAPNADAREDLPGCCKAPADGDKKSKKGKAAACHG